MIDYAIRVGFTSGPDVVETFAAASDCAALAVATKRAKAATVMRQSTVGIVVLWRGPLGPKDTLHEDDYGGKWIAARGSVWLPKETWCRSGRRFVE